MIHFVYVFPPTVLGLRRLGGLSAQVEERLGATSPRRHRPRMPRQSPIAAPRSISVHLFRFLSSKEPTAAYDWQERARCRYGRDDIVLGHPSRDEQSVMQRVMRDQHPCRVKALIFPVHHAMPEYIMPFAPLVERADVVFGIMGQYWYDTIDESPVASWKPKLVRLDMAIDLQEYPLVKRRYNPQGRRGYLYIGRNSPEKGPAVLAQTLAAVGSYPKGWIGPGPDIPGVPRIAQSMRMTPAAVAKLAETFDFFVNTSVSDANPTTILEAMAWGFPVACTPQSGYYRMPSIVSLDIHDINYNALVLRELQFADEEQLLDVARINRHLIETHYTWERFCATVWNGLQGLGGGDRADAEGLYDRRFGP